MSFTPKGYSKPQTGEKTHMTLFLYYIISTSIIKSYLLCLLKTVTSTKSTKPVDDGKKKALLKDNSWIRTNTNEDEKVE